MRNRGSLQDSPVSACLRLEFEEEPRLSDTRLGGNGDELTGPGSRKAVNLRRDPRVALSLDAGTDGPLPVVIRGRVVEWLEGDAAWTVVDEMATKYTGRPYPRGQERVVALIEPHLQKVGMS